MCISYFVQLWRGISFPLHDFSILLSAFELPLETVQQVERSALFQQDEECGVFV